MFLKNLYSNLIIGAIEILLGLIICFLDPSVLLTFIFFVVGGLLIAFGVLTIMTFLSISDSKLKNESLVVALVAFALGILMIAYPHSVACFIAGGLLLVYPIYKIIVSDNKLAALKEQWIKLALGLVLILFGVGSTVKVILYIIGGAMILLGLAEIIYGIYLYIQFKKADKEHHENNDVIDV